MARPRTIAIIPARMGSSRFPGKPLVEILGLPMIEHVRRRALLCEDIDQVLVATCDQEIMDAITGFGGEAVMTSDQHERCTDRIAEAAQDLAADIVVNIQGDEPCVLPRCISDVVRPLQENADCLAACLVYPVETYAEMANPNLVKTVLSQSGSAMYFCRNAIPSQREGECPKLYKQSGIMAYQRDFLLAFTAWSQTPLERIESVDMLRILENDVRVQGVVTPYETPGVDVPEDVEKVERLLQDDPDQQEFFTRIEATS